MPPADPDPPKDKPPDKPRELAERLADPAFRAEIEDAIQKLPPEKAAELLAMLEASLRRRKIELIGYIAAAVVILVGMVIAVYLYGSAPSGSSRAWVFLVPMALAGLTMMIVGRLARGTKPRR